jgi:hypothetical protein
VKLIHSPHALTSPLVAPVLWAALRRSFPHALSAALMPDHIHLLTAASDPDAARLRLARVTSGIRRSHTPAANVRWDRASAEVVAPGRQKLARQCRYIHLNPCRAGLTDDPLRWLWSTHRDVMAAVCDPWTEARRLASCLDRSARHFRTWFHAYVSGDPTVHVAGTPPPSASPHTTVPIFPLGDIMRAAAAVHRLTPCHVARRGMARRTFVTLARCQGWRDRGVLAEACEVTRSAIDWHFAHPLHRGLEAAVLCLGDERLRNTVSSPPLLLGAHNRPDDDRVIPPPLGR